MATRLIIDGNAVYEIDEDCLECRKKKNGASCRMRGQEYSTNNQKNGPGKEKTPGS